MQARLTHVPLHVFVTWVQGSACHGLQRHEVHLDARVILVRLTGARAGLSHPYHITHTNDVAAWWQPSSHITTPLVLAVALRQNPIPKLPGLHPAPSTHMTGASCQCRARSLKLTQAYYASFRDVMDSNTSYPKVPNTMTLEQIAQSYFFPEVRVGMCWVRVHALSMAVCVEHGCVR